MIDSKAADDDGLQTEEERLGAAEAGLRVELDLAGRIGDLLLSPTTPKMRDDDHDDMAMEGEVAVDETPPPIMESSRLVSAIFCLLGVGLLLPWNAFISAEPYFHSRLCSSSSGGGGGGGGDGIELYFGLVFNSFGFLSLVVVLTLRRCSSKLTSSGSGHTSNRSNHSSDVLDAASAEGSLMRDEGKREEQEEEEGEEEDHQQSKFSARKQVLCSLSIYFLMFLLTTIIVLIEKIPHDNFLAITLLCLAVFGACLAMAGTGVVAVASIFPPTVAIAPFFAGQAVGGVFISVSNFLTEYLFESPEKFWHEHCHSNLTASIATTTRSSDDCPPYSIDWATFWYFSLGCSVLAACIIGFITLERLEVTAHYRRIAQLGASAVRETDGINNNLMQPLLSDSMDPPASTLNGEEEGATPERIRAIRMPAVAIHLTAFVTLAIFPAWTSKLESSGQCINHSRLQNDLFEPLGFVMFNAPDLLARLVGPLIVDVDRLRKAPWALTVSAASRFVFFPLFLFCKSSSTAVPSINSDYYTMLIAVCFAFSNGLLMSFCFMLAPQLLSSSEDIQQVGSELMNFSLASGLLGGSCFSFVYNKLATGR